MSEQALVSSSSPPLKQSNIVQSTTVPESIGNLGFEAAKIPLILGIEGLNKGVELLVPGIDDMSFEERKEILKKKLEKITEAMVELAKDPEMQELMRKSGNAFGTLAKELVEAAEQPVLEIVEQNEEFAEKILVQTAKSLTSTAVKMLMAIVAEVPGLGGVVDLGVAFGTAFNGVAKNIEITADNLVKFIEIMNKLTGGVLDPIDTGIDNYLNIRKDFISITDRLTNTLQGFNENQGKIAALQAQTKSIQNN
jgi:hypothetical protein